MRRLGRRRALGLSVAVVTTLHSMSAMAGTGNDQPYPIGEQASGMGGAAVALVKDGSAPWYNPAGLGRVRAEGISASVSAYGIQSERTRGFYTDSSISADLSGWTTAIFPASIGYVKPLDTGYPDLHFRHAVGIAVVVPDFDRHEVNLGVNDQGYGYQLNAYERLLEETFWVIPAWGGCIDGSICVGVSVPATYHSSDGIYSYYEDYPGLTPPTDELTWQQTTWTVGTALQVGVQWQIDSSWRLGANIRSPLRSLGGGGNLLIIDSGFLDPTATSSRRVYDDALWTDYRLPAQLRIGIAFEQDRIQVAGDVLLSLSEAPYQTVLTSGGATLIQPRDSAGNPVGSAIGITSTDSRKAVINANIGARFSISQKYAVQAGVFTDRSAYSQPIDELHPVLNRYGLTLGAVRTTKRSSTYLSLAGTEGTGQSFEINPLNASATSSVSSRAAYVTLGASADFEDPEESKDSEDARPPDGVPLYQRWWFWTAIGAVIAGGLIALVAADARSPGVPGSALGSQQVMP